jgi:hypothetical protein
MTKRVVLTCYCGKPLGATDYEDGSTEFTLVESQMLCPLCLENNNFTLSPYWKYDKPGDKPKQREPEPPTDRDDYSNHKSPRKPKRHQTR